MEKLHFFNLSSIGVNVVLGPDLIGYRVHVGDKGTPSVFSCASLSPLYFPRKTGTLAQSFSKLV